MSTYSMTAKHGKLISVQPDENGELIYLTIESSGDNLDEVRGNTIAIDCDDIEFLISMIQRAAGQAFVTRNLIGGAVQPAQGLVMGGVVGGLGGGMRKTV